MSSSHVLADHGTTILKELSSLREQCYFCDAILQTGDGEKFAVHRCVLVAASSYFKAMFCASFEEAHQEMNSSIMMENISAIGFKPVLDCLYTGKLDLTNEIVYEVLFVAHMLQLGDILKSCESHLRKNISADTIQSNLRLAEKYGLSHHQKAIDTFILQNFEAISKHNDFKKLTKNQLCKYLKKVKGKEVDIYRSAKRWLHTQQLGEDDVRDILNLINFKAIPADILADEVLQDEIILSNKKCLDMALDGVEYHSNIIKQPLFFSNNIRREEKVIIVKQGTGIIMCDKTNLRKTTVTWKLSLAPYDFVGRSGNAVNINNFVFFFGTDSKSFSTVAKRCDGTIGEWMDLVPAPKEGTVGSAVNVVGDHIIMVGGMHLTKYYIAKYYTIKPARITDDTLSYSVQENEWRQLPECPARLVYHASCSDKEILYAAGGYTPNHRQDRAVVTPKLYAYNTRAGIWLALNSMHHGRAEATLAMLDNKLYILGGCTLKGPVHSVEMYDIVQNQWTVVEEGARLPYPAASFVDGKDIMVLGGVKVRHIEESDCIYVFNTESKKTSTLRSKLPTPISGHSCLFLKL